MVIGFGTDQMVLKIERAITKMMLSMVFGLHGIILIIKKWKKHLLMEILMGKLLYGMKMDQKIVKVL